MYLFVSKMIKYKDVYDVSIVMENVTWKKFLKVTRGEIPYKGLTVTINLLVVVSLPSAEAQAPFLSFLTSKNTRCVLQQ